ncbi:hypothetical protein ACE414_17595 [Alteromonas macleodii]
MSRTPTAITAKPVAEPVWPFAAGRVSGGWKFRRLCPGSAVGGGN